MIPTISYPNHRLVRISKTSICDTILSPSTSPLSARAEMTMSLILSGNKIGFCYQSPRDESWEGPCIFPWVYLSISSKERPERARLVLIQYANHGLVISELSYSHNEDHEDVFFPLSPCER